MLLCSPEQVIAPVELECGGEVAVLGGHGGVAGRAGPVLDPLVFPEAGQLRVRVQVRPVLQHQRLKLLKTTQCNRKFWI